MEADRSVRRRFDEGTTIEDLKAYMEPFVERLGYVFNTDVDFVDEVLTAELEILEQSGDVYCPCRVRSGDPREDLSIVCPCIPFYADRFAKLQKCWCGLFISKDVEDGAALHGVVTMPDGPAQVWVARLEWMPRGCIHAVRVGSKEIALTRVGDEVYALSNICRHAFGPLGSGFVDDYVVTCPWHGWQYDVRTGATDHPNSDVRTYPVTIREGEVFVTV